MIDLRRLRILRELKIRGTLAGVAAAMSYSPSAVSQQLAILEKEAGVPLLTRAGRRVQLTPQAEILVTHTNQLLEQMELMESEMNASLGEVSGTLRMAVFQSAALGIVPQALTSLGQRYPELRVEVTQREPESALASVWVRDFDLVIAEQYPGHTARSLPELDRETLCLDRLRLATAPGSNIGSIAEAARMPWVMEPRGTASRHWSEQACRAAGFEPDVRFETPDLQAQIRLIESGNAVSILPDLVWVDLEPTLRMIDLPGNPARTVFTSVRDSSRHNPGILACRSVLLEAVGAV